MIKQNICISDLFKNKGGICKQNQLYYKDYQKGAKIPE